MKGRSTKELEQLKSLSLKIWEVRSKSVAITEKNNMANHTRPIIDTNQWRLSTTVSPAIDFSPAMGQSSVVENTFVDECK